MQTHTNREGGRGEGTKGLGGRGAEGLRKRGE